jgi:ribosomal protein L11 methyltransferase
MNDTIEIIIAIEDQGLREELIAQLAAIKFDGFEEKEKELSAFTAASTFERAELDQLLGSFNLGYTLKVIPDQNWNAVWESNFSPVIVGDFCGIRADFHHPISGIEHEIIITPKMSFGTGHHATTYLMISEMRKIDFKKKKVADFGTGTGILAILSEKLGSDYVWAIDIDDWSIQNAAENVDRNHCKNIFLQKKNGFETDETFDIMLANINKHVILENLNKMFHSCKSLTYLLVSGLLKDDEAEVVSAFERVGFKHFSTNEKDKWICLSLQYELKSE